MYIERIKREGAALDLNLQSIVEEFGLGSATPNSSTVGNAELKAELKKMSKLLRQLIHLKKQQNMMAALFYCCVIAVGVVYVLISGR
jgi:hypothetical protein